MCGISTTVVAADAYSVHSTPYMLDAQPIANVHPINFELSRSYRHLDTRALSCLVLRPGL